MPYSSGKSGSNGKGKYSTSSEDKLVSSFGEPLISDYVSLNASSYCSTFDYFMAFLFGVAFILW
jgi:hypothetical protein